MNASLGLVAGETSGDYLGAELIEALRADWPDLQVRGVGGPKSIAAGLKTLFPMEKMQVMGLLEPLLLLPELLYLRRRLRLNLLAEPPQTFVGIDAPDFNLSLEAALKKQGIPTVHYVSPTVWAWRRNRLKTIARAVDCVLCLLPFELEIYRKAAIPAHYVGHPLARQVPQQPDAAARRKARKALGVAEGAPLIAVLPGSRSGEVRHNLPTMLAALDLLHQRHPDATFAAAPAGPARLRQIRQLLARSPTAAASALQLLEGAVAPLLAAADVALVVMGTATLEVMLHRTPMVATYRTGALNFHLIRSLSYLEMFALPNLLAGERLIPEILQADATPKALADAICDLLDRDSGPLQQRFAELHALLAAADTTPAEVVAELAGWKH